MVRTLSAATALAILCLIGAPAVAKKCPKACAAELRDDFRRCDDDCPERKAGKDCRKICRGEFHKTKTACQSVDAGVVFDQNVCCSQDSGPCIADARCCSGLECSGAPAGTCVAIPTTTTTVVSSTNTTTTMPNTGGLNCRASASLLTPGGTTLSVYGDCSSLATATSIGFLFDTPFAPLAGFTAPSKGNCQITSWPPGTNNYYVCTGAFIFQPGGTVPGGSVQGSTSPGPTLPFSFYIGQGSNLLGPFPGNYGG